jgi:hypothetical protein
LLINKKLNKKNFSFRYISNFYQKKLDIYVKKNNIKIFLELITFFKNSNIRNLLITLLLKQNRHIKPSILLSKFNRKSVGFNLELKKDFNIK